MKYDIKAPATVPIAPITNAISSCPDSLQIFLTSDLNNNNGNASGKQYSHTKSYTGALEGIIFIFEIIIESNTIITNAEIFAAHKYFFSSQTPRATVPIIAANTNHVSFDPINDILLSSQKLFSKPACHV